MRNKSCWLLTGHRRNFPHPAATRDKFNAHSSEHKSIQERITVNYQRIIIATEIKSCCVQNHKFLKFPNMFTFEGKTHLKFYFVKQTWKISSTLKSFKKTKKNKSKFDNKISTVDDKTKKCTLSFARNPYRWSSLSFGSIITIELPRITIIPISFFSPFWKSMINLNIILFFLNQYQKSSKTSFLSHTYEVS